MNLDHIDRLLLDALPWLAVTLFPLLLILTAVFGSEAHRLGEDDEHDVSDFAPPAAPPRNQDDRRWLRPAPSATPIHDEVASLPMSDDTARKVARVYLADIAAVEQAKAGIRPAASVQQAPSCSHGYSTHKNRAGVTMHPNGKPCTDADMTGAFPVVRAAA